MRFPRKHTGDPLAKHEILTRLNRVGKRNDALMIFNCLMVMLLVTLFLSINDRSGLTILLLLIFAASWVLALFRASFHLRFLVFFFAGQVLVGAIKIVFGTIDIGPIIQRFELTFTGATLWLIVLVWLPYLTAAWYFALTAGWRSYDGLGDAK